MKTIYKKDTLLKDGEVYVIEQNKHSKEDGSWVFTPGNMVTNPGVGRMKEGVLKSGAKACLDFFKITHSTAKLAGVTQLPRDKFVKPVEEEAKEYALAQGENARNYAVAHDFICGRGKFEFTKQQLIDAMYDAFEYPNKRTPEATITEFVDRYVKDLTPLSLPESFQIDENNNVVNVKF